MWKYNREPTPPGEILNVEFLKPLKLTQKQCADHLGVDVKVINRICNAKSSITPIMAVKLASAFGTTPEFWLNAQIATDLWKIRQSSLELPEQIKSNHTAIV